MGSEAEKYGIERQAKAAQVAPGEKVTQGRLRALLHSQRFRCALTGEALEPGNCSLDHIVPRSRGGRHIMPNCQIVLQTANQQKGTQTYAELIASCRKILRWHSLKKRRARAAAERHSK